MLVNLEQCHPSTETPTMLDVDQDSTVEDLIILYRHLKQMTTSREMVILGNNGQPLPEEKTMRELKIPSGHTLRIAYKDDIAITNKKWFRYMLYAGIIVAIIIIILGIVLYFALKDKKKPMLQQSLLFRRKNSILFQNHWCDNPQSFTRKYDVVVDDGQSNTCVASYSWNEKYKGTGCVIDENYCCIKNNKGGLTNRNPENHIRRIMVCIKNVTNSIEDKQRITIYVVATENMKIQGDAAGKQRLNSSLNKMVEYLERAKFLKLEIEEMSEKDEALYGWIAANYLRTTFKEDSPAATYGFLDMGVTSVGISFSSNGGEDTKNIKLYGKEYNIFTKSYRCFGIDSAKERYQSFLIKDIAETDVEDPCLPENESEIKSGSQLFMGICTHNNRFTKSVEKHQEIVNRKYTFRGTSNPSLCRKSISKILSEESCKRNAFRDCFQKIVVPKDMKFLAYSDFFSTLKLINFQQGNLRLFSYIADDFCFRDIKTMDSNISEKDRVELCFRLQYIYELLVTGYGFTSQTWNNLKFVGNEMNNEDFSWTLGYIITKTNDN